MVGCVLILEAGTELALDQKRLGGDTADIDAGAAVHSSIALDQEHGLARTSQVCGKGLTRLAKAYDEVGDLNLFHNVS